MTGAPRALRLRVAIGSLAMAAHGCSLVGLGIGSAVPRYEAVPATELERGERTKIEVAAHARAGPITHVKGRFVEVRETPASSVSAPAEPGHLIVLDEVQVFDTRMGWLDPQGRRTVPVGHAAVIRQQQGDYLGLGFAVGLVVDAVLVTLVAVAASSGFDWGSEDDGFLAN